jgi:hypothetical protein
MKRLFYKKFGSVGELVKQEMCLLEDLKRVMIELA